MRLLVLEVVVFWSLSVWFGSLSPAEHLLTAAWQPEVTAGGQSPVLSNPGCLQTEKSCRLFPGLPKCGVAGGGPGAGHVPLVTESWYLLNTTSVQARVPWGRGLCSWHLPSTWCYPGSLLALWATGCKATGCGFISSIEPGLEDLPCCHCRGISRHVVVLAA